MINKDVPPELELLPIGPSDLALAFELSEGHHRLPVLFVFAGLDDKCDVSFTLADHPTLADPLGHLEFTLDKLADATRVKVKRVTIATLELLFVEKVSVVGYFLDFVRDLGVLRVCVPLGEVT